MSFEPDKITRDEVLGAVRKIQEEGYRFRSVAYFSQTMPAVSLASMPLSISMRVTIEI